VASFLGIRRFWRTKYNAVHIVFIIIFATLHNLYSPVLNPIHLMNFGSVFINTIVTDGLVKEEQKICFTAWQSNTR